MDYIGAMEATVKLARKNPWWTLREGCSVYHLEEMLRKAAKEKDKAKLARQLGWMQAVVYCWAPVDFTPETFKKINRRFKRKKGSKK